MRALVFAGFPATRNNRYPTGFDAAGASAVFFKLPCLKLFGHDKMNGFIGRVRCVQYQPGQLRGGMNGGFESWRYGPGDRASRGYGKRETQIKAQLSSRQR